MWRCRHLRHTDRHLPSCPLPEYIIVNCCRSCCSGLQRIGYVISHHSLSVLENVCQSVDRKQTKWEVWRIFQNCKKCNQIFHQENSQNTSTQQHMGGCVTWPDRPIGERAWEFGNWVCVCMRQTIETHSQHYQIVKHASKFIIYNEFIKLPTSRNPSRK